MSRRKRRQQQRDAAQTKRVSAKLPDSVLGSLGAALKHAFAKAGIGSKEARPEGKISAPSAPTAKSIPPPVSVLGQSSQRDRVTPQARAYTGEVELVVGLDFGTSCTKLVLQEVERERVYAVPLRELAGMGSGWLLPTAVQNSRNGEYCLKGDGDRFVDLKRIMLWPAKGIESQSDRERKSAQRNVVAYLALALKLLFSWFDENKASRFLDNKIIWQLNLGLPADNCDDPALISNYRVIGAAAWEAAVDGRLLTADIIDAAILIAEKAVHGKDDAPLGKDNRELDSDLVGVIPEVLAEVQGYLRSDMRKTGFHLLADVGAGTLDVSVFYRFVADHEEKLPVHVTWVGPLGARSLFDYQADTLIRLFKHELEKLAQADDELGPLPDLVTAELPRPSSQEMTDALAVFSNNVGNAIANVMKEARVINPTHSSWDDEVTVILCGGGADLPLYKERLQRVETDFGFIKGFNYLELPVPEGFEDKRLLPAEYRRLAVAYGLSFRAIDIGEFDSLASVSPPPKAKGRDISQNYIGPEHV